MKREILQKLQVKDLEHYKDTLTKRISQLKHFNIQLGKDNVQLTTKITEIRKKLSQKPQKVSKNTFDFDDLFKMGMARVATTGGMFKLWSASEEKLKQGLGYVNKIVKKYVSKKQEKYEIENEVNDRPQQTENMPKMQRQTDINGQRVNEDLDFNSYQLGMGSIFKNQTVPQQTKPRRKIFEKEQNKNVSQQKRQPSCPQKENNEDENEEKGQQGQQEKQVTEQQKQDHRGQEQSKEQQKQGDAGQMKKQQNDEAREPKEEQKEKQSQKPNEGSQEKVEEQEDKGDDKADEKGNEKTEQKGQLQKQSKQQKFTKVEDNKIVDIQNESQSSAEETK